MPLNTIVLNISCCLCVCLISLASSHLYKKEPLISSEFILLFSTLPGFGMSSLLLITTQLNINYHVWIVIFVKNVLYCLSFYFKYESLRRFGPFTGALMLGTQPLFLSLLGMFLLGERLTIHQDLSVAVAVASLSILFLARQATKTRPVNTSQFLKYYLLPTLISSISIIVDRFFLKETLSGSDFFIIDRFTLMVSAVSTVFFIRGKNLGNFFWNRRNLSTFKTNWVNLAFISALFTISGYVYTLALAHEKAIIVGLFRISAYPIAALIGAFVFKQKLLLKEWLSLAFVCSAIMLSSL